MNKHKISRRDFLKWSSIAALPITLGGFPISTQARPRAMSFENENDKILVLVQLQGGNDGLSTIYDMNEYANLQAVRSNIIVPDTSIIPFSGTQGFHPVMGNLKQVWDAGNLGIVHSVGYPNQNRSHFRSSDIWHSGSDADAYVATGWIGRFYDLNFSDYPMGYPSLEQSHPFALTMGRLVSETCQGVNANYSLALEDPFNPGTALVGAEGAAPANCYGDMLTFVNDTVAQTNAYSAAITLAANTGNNLSTKYEDFGSTSLAMKLKNVARLISGGLQTKVYIVQIGGFDTHDNQVDGGDTTTGIHGNLLQELSDAICAFQEDLELLGVADRVVGMTYSEFGRRILSNGSLGTDHGTAAPLFLFGTCVKDEILGTHPTIDPAVGIEDGVAMQYDFRNIYGTILSQWLGASVAEVQNILFPSFTPLPLFKDGCIVPNTLVKAKISLQGAYDGNTNTMTTILKDNNLLPLTQPFNTAPWNYVGTECVASFDNLGLEVVDWVLVEMRDGNDVTSIVESHAALLLADGSIVDASGLYNGVKFDMLTNGNAYYILIRHRNHLDVLAANTVIVPNDAPYDFRQSNNMVMGVAQMVEVATGVFALRAGDINAEGVVTVADVNLYQSQASGLNSYLEGDCNLDGNATVSDYNLLQGNSSVIGYSEVRY